MKKKVVFILGTRPEAIKLAPVIEFFLKKGEFLVEVCSTGQHKEMLYQILDYYNIVPTIDLKLMVDNQSLVGLNSLALVKISEYLSTSRPDLIVVQGDTTTVQAAAMAAFYNRIPIAHVEAGLRTNDLYSPFPEEMNRLVTSVLSSIHFAPTTLSRDNLLREGHLDSNIHVTGNTVIDALLNIKKKMSNGELDLVKFDFLDPSRKMILITGHRRESFGDGIREICQAIKRLSNEYPNVDFVYPVHLNPNIKQPVLSILDNLKNVFLLEPQSYLSFITLLDRSYLVLTDSGGVQEEAPTLGKPVLVMRDKSERPEALMSGTSILVGNTEKSIYENTVRLLEDHLQYEKMSKAINPYGDGKACEKIYQIILNYFNENLNN
ncbi:non-hydrolyzing UDP-N-acetylglucosamine 2-epimerase [Sphingobacterium paucimobilis]|uniref:UDP-N-acetylglucosamine 2-epimerase (non-hydrolyzing) n=1 Tax=Sphingobacterium paucimobilis HER1398 TaxID=1346330 RepID=U2IYE1_9SPHI|nr:UDP-N-acetylglucosamine 2-epimerase (non-hydrolyzing) [Sphingobacterium paucimobilis]ERJ57719.1 hypothetical protein M472_02965 [Sphingobacterium paucimobilis HER1398]